MGVSNGSDLIYTADKLSLSQLATIARARNNEHGQRIRPCIDLDANLLAHKLNGGKDIVKELIAFAMAITKENLDVAIVCDGPVRDHSKRATTKRAAEREKFRLKALFSKLRLQQLRSQKENPPENFDISQANKDVVILEKRVKSSESRSRTHVPPDFFSRLSQAVAVEHARTQFDSDDTTSSGELSLHIAKFQADTVICYRLVHGHSHIAVTTDTDYQVLAGEHALLVRAWKFPVEKNNSRVRILSDLELACGVRGTMANAATALHKDVDSFVTKSAKYPLFDGKDARTRALIAVGLGCDSFPGGAKSLGPSMMAKYLDENGTSCLLDFVSSKAKIEVTAVETFCDTLLYEPANTIDPVSGKMNEPMYLYIHDPPMSLPKYLAAFTDRQEIMVDGPEMCTCVGPESNSSHSFLAAEGTFNCTRCQEQMCRFCCFELDNEQPKKLRCVRCHSLMLVGSGVKNSGPTVQCMRGELVARNILEARAEGTSLEIEDMYEAYVENNHNDLYGQEDGVSFPIAPSCIINNGDLMTIHTFEFQEGGRLLRGENITDWHRKDLIIMFAKYVSYNGKGKEHKDAKGSCKNVYHAVPDVLVDIAEGSRHGSGYRLLERSCRHVMDAASTSLYNANGKVAEYNGETCLLINNDIRASMLDKCYDCTCVVSKSGIVACKCNCKAGSISNNKHVDVHAMAELMGLTLLLFDGLAENILVELSAEWSTRDPEFDDKDEERKLLDALWTLKCAASIEMEENTRANNLKVSDLLRTFSVGTEQSKLAPPPPKENEIVAFRTIQVQSVGNLVVAKIENAKQEQKRQANAALYGVEAGRVEAAESHHNKNKGAKMQMSDWIAIEISVSSINEAVRASHKNPKRAFHPSPKRLETIGHQLISYRARRTKADMGDKIVSTLTRESISAWKQAFEKAAKRRERVVNESRKSSESESINHCFGEKDNTESEQHQRPAIEMVTGETEDVGLASLEERPPKKARTYCSVNKCRNNDSNGQWTFSRIPSAVSKKHRPQPGMRARVWERLAKKKFLRAETLRRCGLGSSDNRSKLLICSAHQFETKSLAVKVESIAADGTTSQYSKTFAFHLPTANGTKSKNLPAKEFSKGLGDDRQKVKLLTKLNEEEKTNNEVSWRLCSQRLAETGAKDAANLNNTNKSVLVAAGLTIHHDVHTNMKRKRISEIKSNKTPKGKDNDEKEPWEHDPVVDPCRITAKEVKRRTSFEDVESLLAFLAIICNGDIEKVCETASCLTWFEEWMMYAEYIWGKTGTRWEDIAHTYRVCETTARKVVGHKKALILKCRSRWPMFVSQEEDEALRNDRWNCTYKGRRVVFWDNTNVDMRYKPTDASLNRRTYSSYYGGNVAKGGVFLQLCGWLGAFALWVGAVSDTKYLSESGILEMQQDFVKTDLTSNLPFTNIVDKGYRCVIAAWRKGQYLVQPKFARSDRKFTTADILTSACIATDRAGNERAVNVCKYSGVIQRGLYRNGNMADLDDSWLAWSFQSNFVFRPVL